MLHNAWSPSSVTHHSWSISHCQWWCGFTIIFMWLSWSFCDAIITWMMTIIIKIIKETKMKNWRLSHPISCWILIYIYVYIYMYIYMIYIDIIYIYIVVTPGFRGLFPHRIHRAEDLFKALQGQLHGVAVPELPWPLGMVGMSELTADSQVFYVQTHRYDSIRFYTQYVYIKYTYFVYIHLITFIS